MIFLNKYFSSITIYFIYTLQKKYSCPRIASVPTGCHFVQDPKEACCQTLVCDPTASLGTCTDTINNCDQYGSYVCTGQYLGWAKTNCAKYCGICGTG